MERSFQVVCVLVVLAFSCVGLRIALGRIGRSGQLLTGAYIAFGILAVAAYRPSENEVIGPNGLLIAYYRTLSSWTVFSFFALAGVACCVGASIASGIWPTKGTNVLGSSRRGISATFRIVLPSWSLWFCAVLVAIYLYGIGLDSVVHSDGYLAHTGPAVALNIYTGLGPVGVLVAANVLLGGRASRVARMFSVLLLFVAITLYFGQATRAFALCPLLVYGGGFVSGRWTRPRAVVLGICATVAAILLVGVPLYLRSQDQHGLGPALEYLRTRPTQFFSNESNPVTNLLLGVPLSLYVGNVEHPIAHSAFWVSINPLPGSLTSWPSLAPTLRVNEYEPFSGLGELANYGTAYSISYMVAIGFILRSLELLASSCSLRLAGILVGTLPVEAGLIFLMSTQYNLRSETRIVYYSIALIVTCWLLDRLINGAKRSPTSAVGVPL